jgi:plasmid maintenance system antidote protein VapI
MRKQKRRGATKSTTSEFKPDYAVHPGEHIAEVMIAHELSRETYSVVMRHRIQGIIDNCGRIDRSVAKELVRHGYGSEQFWLNLQANYDAAPASAKRRAAKAGYYSAISPATKASRTSGG